MYLNGEYLGLKVLPTWVCSGVGIRVCFAGMFRGMFRGYISGMFRGIMSYCACNFGGMLQGMFRGYASGYVSRVCKPCALLKPGPPKNGQTHVGTLGPKYIIAGYMDP